MIAPSGSSAESWTAGAYVDLQTHTTASDGALGPADVVRAAKAASLFAIAITDHDTLEGLAEADATGRETGVRIVHGVELSTYFGKDELHLLGLHLRTSDELELALDRFRTARVERAREMVEALNKLGVPVTLESVMLEAGSGSVGRPHLARALVAGSWVRDFREAFDRYLAFGKPAFRPRERFEVADAISLVHSAGGLAVWAHPGESATSERVAALKAHGLDGVEVLHPSHSQYQSQKILEIVEAQGLLPSGGSDWHGTQDGGRKLGGMNVPREWLELQDERCAA